jgi:hypothetical protein
MHKYSVSWNAQVVPIVMCGTLAKTRDFCHDVKTGHKKKPGLRKYDFFCFIRLFAAWIFVCSVDRARLSSSDENRQKNKHENEWISYSYSYSKTPWANNFMSE